MISAAARFPNLESLEHEYSGEQRSAMKNVSRQFEAILIGQMVNAMRSTVTPGGLIPQSHAQTVYQSMLDTEHATQLAETQQLGLSKMVYEHLLRTSRVR